MGLQLQINAGPRLGVFVQAALCCQLQQLLVKLQIKQHFDRRIDPVRQTRPPPGQYGRTALARHDDLKTGCTRQAGLLADQ